MTAGNKISNHHHTVFHPKIPPKIPWEFMRDDAMIRDQSMAFRLQR